MSTEKFQPIFTIGHSNLEIERFVELLNHHRIQAVADVRSFPYSQYNPQFSREILQRTLREHHIAYVFLGTELGARRPERECYVNGRADYDLIARTAAFKKGIKRIMQGAEDMRVALMCAEKDPLDCHRCILVSPHLRERGLTVSHILNDGSVESHEQTESRLLHLHGLPESELFRSAAEIIAEAYHLQGNKIAYQEEELALHEGLQGYGA